MRLYRRGNTGSLLSSSIVLLLDWALSPSASEYRMHSRSTISHLVVHSSTSFRRTPTGRSTPFNSSACKARKSSSSAPGCKPSCRCSVGNNCIWYLRCLCRELRRSVRDVSWADIVTEWRNIVLVNLIRGFDQLAITWKKRVCLIWKTVRKIKINKSIRLLSNRKR